MGLGLKYKIMAKQIKKEKIRKLHYPQLIELTDEVIEKAFKQITLAECDGDMLEQFGEMVSKRTGLDWELEWEFVPRIMAIDLIYLFLNQRKQIQGEYILPETQNEIRKILLS